MGAVSYTHLRAHETPAAGSDVMGTAPIERADVEEVEEEDPDVHFKRKREGGSRRKQLVKNVGPKAYHSSFDDD